MEETRKGRYVGIAMLVLGTSLLVLSGRAEMGGAAIWSTLVIQNALDDSVLVDVRWKERSGQIEGPIARALSPDARGDFGIRNDRAFCIRVIHPVAGGVRAVRLQPTRGAIQSVIRLDAQILDRSPASSARCEPDLEQDRVRVAVGRYFEPDRPDRIRRERLLWR